MPPINQPMGGIMMSLTTEETILPNALPIITPTAISITLPLTANSLKSWMNVEFFIVDRKLISYVGTNIEIIFVPLPSEKEKRGTHLECIKLSTST